ncbi:hypothetical protein ACVW16_001327 [Bradyrhizobium sp. USDA 4474]
MTFNLATSPFAATSSWNTPVNSNATYTHLNWYPSTGYNYGASWSSYSPSVYVASSTDPVVQVSVPATWGWPGGTVSVHMPTAANGATGTDGELVVVDGDIAYNFWQFNRTGATTATAKAYGESNVVTGTGWGTRSPFLSAGITASGSSELGGLLVQAETDTGTINHALQLTVDGSLVKSGFTGSAIASDGGSSTGIVQEGDHLAISPNTPMPSGLSALGQEVFRAMQKYGAYVVDVAGSGGAAIRVQANAYNSTTINALSHDMGSIAPMLEEITGGTPTTSGTTTSTSGGTTSSGTTTSTSGGTTSSGSTTGSTSSGSTTVTDPTGTTSSGTTSSGSPTASGPTTPPSIPSVTRPVLTIADHSLTVGGRGGTVDLGAKVTTTDSNDLVTVNITGLPKYESITDKLDGQTFRGNNITLTAAQVDSGLELTSSYRGGGHPVATLSLTASAKDPSTGAVSTASPQTITVTDPRPTAVTTTTSSQQHHVATDQQHAATTTTTAAMPTSPHTIGSAVHHHHQHHQHHHHHHHQHQHHHQHHHHIAMDHQHGDTTTRAVTPTPPLTIDTAVHPQATAANTGSLASRGFALLQQHFDPATSTLATTTPQSIAAADHPIATGMASSASQSFALLNQYLAGHTGHVDAGQIVSAVSQAIGLSHEPLLARPQH